MFSYIKKILISLSMFIFHKLLRENKQNTQIVLLSTCMYCSNIFSAKFFIYVNIVHFNYNFHVVDNFVYLFYNLLF